MHLLNNVGIYCTILSWFCLYSLYYKHTNKLTANQSSGQTRLEVSQRRLGSLEGVVGYSLRCPYFQNFL